MDEEGITQANKRRHPVNPMSGEDADEGEN
jgi:hypothetical protein